ncbi:MAG TPA: (Fe-S)-binding protein [Methanomassiliicoccales archaeon]|nr:(Fe-S)-binding protein [Methanomassiliicoccales archaeon]
MGALAIEPSGFGEEKCVECGRCTYACPVSRMRDFSPRNVVEKTLLQGKPPADPGIWQCMNCAACTQVCQNGVDFHRYVRTLRPQLAKTFPPQMNHGAIPHSLMRINAVPGIVPKKNAWLTSEMKIDADSETLLYVGCTPYLDTLFRYLELDLLSIPRSAVRLLNHVGIRPKILADERCCGHDAYWLGEDELFSKLARMNVEMLDRAKASRIVAFCPECMTTLKQLYPKVVGPLGFEVVSLAELLAEEIDSGRLDLATSTETITYHDPCRLGRHVGIYDAPRTVLGRSSKLVEMPRSRELGPCCGVSAFTQCGSETRPWQFERLREAAAAGASSLVTACPKCLVHLTCATREKTPLMVQDGMRIEDIYVRTAARIK